MPLRRRLAHNTFFADLLDEAPMEQSFKKTKGLRRIWNAFDYSRAGLAAAFRGEAAFRQECLLAAILLPAALLLPLGPTAKALLVGTVFLVLVVELLNSAVEAVVDLASPEQHPLAKRAKDLGSAAVFMSLVLLGAVWLLVLWP